MANFASAAQLEVWLRPLRRRVNIASMEMFGRVVDEGVVPSRLVGFASNLRAILSRVGGLVAAIDDCPCGSELEVTGEQPSKQIIQGRLQSLRDRRTVG
jgi:hypothetical protein